MYLRFCYNFTAVLFGICLSLAVLEAGFRLFAHVAKPYLSAVIQLEHEVDVAILRRAGRNDEELAGHLEVDGQDGVFGRVGFDRTDACP